jgi:hypothetical protein
MDPHRLLLLALLVGVFYAGWVFRGHYEERGVEITHEEALRRMREIL